MFSWMSEAHAESSNFMPPQAATFSKDVDDLYMFLLIISAISMVLVIGGMIVFAYKYRRRSDKDKTPYIAHNGLLEFLWSFIPFVLFIVVFVWGWVVYHKLRYAPKSSLEVHVTGQKWNWEFAYKSGRKSSGELFVPVNTPVKLIMTSRDVIHSFFIPAFRTKQDVVPGAYSSLWFEANRIGDFQVFCTEFCGDKHSEMLAKVKVISRDDYETWLQSDPYKGLSEIQVGEKLFQGRCTACHSATTERKIGPGLGGVFGKQRELEGGATQAADESYIQESILNPAKKVVKGYPNAMTPFQGQLSQDELRGLVEYIKSLKE